MVDEVQTYLCPGLPGRYVQLEDYVLEHARAKEAADRIKALQAQLAKVEALVKAAEMMVEAYRIESDQTITAFYALEDAFAAMKEQD